MLYRRWDARAMLARMKTALMVMLLSTVVVRTKGHVTSRQEKRSNAHALMNCMCPVQRDQHFHCLDP